MAVLEVGINLGMKKLVEIMYYSSADNVLDPALRARFLNGLEEFINEVYGDEITVISLSSYQIVCYCEMIRLPGKEPSDTQPLLSFAIIEKGTDHNFVKQHLEEILTNFLNRYTPDDIFTKSPKYFKDFEPRINEILEDLRLNTEDRIKAIFRN
ncbi:MAG: hypothetical protein ACFFA0_10105 [Promethearchaeota archaeon]